MSYNTIWRMVLISSYSAWVSEEIKIGFGTEKCPKCNKSAKLPQPIISEIKLVNCPQCNILLQAKFRIRIGRPVIFLKKESVFWENEFPLLKLSDIDRSLYNIIEDGKDQIIDIKLLRNYEGGETRIQVIHEK